MPGTLRQVIDTTTVAMLRARGSVKWAAPGPAGFGAAVAEMDFGAAPPILDALAGLSADANFGYLPPFLADELAAACAEFQQRRYGWEIDPALIHPVPDVIKALEIAITHYSRPGSPVILPTPAYMPFLAVPEYLGREIIQVPMRGEAGFFTLDFGAIEDAYRAGGHLLILCNPYNPLGRVFTSAELTQLTDVVERHRGRVFADEIHAPLVYPGLRHLPYAATSGAAASHTLTATSASKAWNLPGLKCAQVILSNEPDQQRWEQLGILRPARCEQSRRRRQHRRLPARRSLAERGPRLPRRQPPPAGRPAQPPPAAGPLPPARRHLPGLARLHRPGPAGLTRRPGYRPRPHHGRGRPRLRHRRRRSIPVQLRHPAAHPHRNGRAHRRHPEPPIGAAGGRRMIWRQ